ncbi:ribosomal protein S5 domain 2-like protein [Tuber magnatum]|uniref:Ribosomal protein S5 domain 2-like protein n=1 Tax=Tuber magnatum TaxID=42249 RepID=A0A317SPK9_9PEZI|nr:ribosomal protein S5 domain 2-like protein [Tuber magnatum]
MADKKVYSASTTAPVNITVVKYWGKHDTKLNLPTNFSLSQLTSEARDIAGVRETASFRQPEDWRKDLKDANPSLPKLSECFVHAVSEDNFPTTAGLASSAAGFAALVPAIADLYELPNRPTELSKVARQGSGSACRSLFGGYVAWEIGQAADGRDSSAVEVVLESHWPDVKAVIPVVSAAKKVVSPKAGMQATV